MTLKKVFGYDSFRSNQEQIINNILDGNHSLVIMPTGSGKSLCYQLPAIYLGNISLIISPLIALMKNQVDFLQQIGVRAEVLNSSLPRKRSIEIQKECLEGKIRLLYVAPESLAKQANLEFFSSLKISFVAIDEAQCISEWGHDFRPEYRRISSVTSEFAQMPIIALTATATPKVQNDILENLKIPEARIFKSSYDRKNLFYRVLPKVGVSQKLLSFVKSRAGVTGIIYCLSRKEVDEIAEMLKINGIKVLPYHAGLNPKKREENQDAFLNEDVDVIVATIAFGLGINKPDVRFVIHYFMPKSIEGYYQETGRAGRDGLEGVCVMFFDQKDADKLRKLVRDKPPLERQSGEYMLEEMIANAKSSICRRKTMLKYLGEGYKNDNCGMCDNCVEPVGKFEGSESMVKLINCLEECSQLVAGDHIIDILLGLAKDSLKGYGHDRLESFGAGNDQDRNFWESVLQHGLYTGILERSFLSPKIVKVTKLGKKYCKKPYDILVNRNRDYEKLSQEGLDNDEINRFMAISDGHDHELYEILKKLCREISKKVDLPPYLIFQDNSLREMAISFPTTEEKMKTIIGVGEVKVKKYGEPFIECIKAFVEENGIEVSDSILVKTAGKRSKDKIFIIQQIDKETNLDYLAECKKIGIVDLVSDIENICNSGVKLDLSYYLDTILDQDQRDEILDYFMDTDDDDISEAIEELSDKFSEKEIRLSRVNFISHHS